MIGIVGGSGGFGQGIATRLRAHGHDVLIGSRTPRDDFVSNPEACDRSDVVFLSVPPAHVEAMAHELGPHLRGKIAVSVATAVVFRDGRPTAEPGPVSIAELLAAGAPEARVVSGFHTVSAKGLADAAHELDDDVLLCGDDEEAKESVSVLAAPDRVGPCHRRRAARRSRAGSRRSPLSS